MTTAEQADRTARLILELNQRRAQLQDVVAVLDQYGERDDAPGAVETLTAPEDGWRMFRDLRAVLDRLPIPTRPDPREAI